MQSVSTSTNLADVDFFLQASTRVIVPNCFDSTTLLYKYGEIATYCACTGEKPRLEITLKSYHTR